MNPSFRAYFEICSHTSKYINFKSVTAKKKSTYLLLKLEDRSNSVRLHQSLTIMDGDFPWPRPNKFRFLEQSKTEKQYYYYYYYCSEHSASRTAVAAYTIVLHLSLSWAVVMASFIVSPSLSFIVLVSLVFCRPLDRQ